MLLAVDIGNSNITIGVFAGGPEPAFAYHLATDVSRSADEYAILILNIFKIRKLEPQAIDDAAVSSVVPQLTRVLEEAIRGLFHCRVLTIGAGVKTGFNIRTEAPAEVGADIIANAAAALARVGPPAGIADLGTVTTIFALDRRSVLVGGVILPGVYASLEGLRSSTAQLPYVSLKQPASVIGRNTADCICSGLVLGHAISLDGFTDRFMAELKLEPAETALLATGGAAPLILGACRHHFQYDPHLTLKGLSAIFENTRQRAGRNP